MTQRLVALAVEHWKDLDGFAVAHAIPSLHDLSLDRFCNFVWWWATREADQKERDRFERRLYQPPKGYAPKTGPWSAEAETSAFASLRQSLKA